MPEEVHFCVKCQFSIDSSRFGEINLKLVELFSGSFSLIYHKFTCFACILNI